MDQQVNSLDIEEAQDLFPRDDNQHKLHHPATAKSRIGSGLLVAVRNRSANVVSRIRNIVRRAPAGVGGAPLFTIVSDSAAKVPLVSSSNQEADPVVRELLHNIWSSHFEGTLKQPETTKIKALEESTEISNADSDANAGINEEEFTQLLHSAWASNFPTSVSGEKKVASAKTPAVRNEKSDMMSEHTSDVAYAKETKHGVMQLRTLASDEEPVASSGGNGGALGKGQKVDDNVVTEKEWLLVSELRNRSLAFAVPNKDEYSRSWWMWNDGDGLTDLEYLRFLRHNNGNLEVAWKHLQETSDWRAKNNVDDVLSEEHWEDFEATKELFWLGDDKEGRPTLVLRSIHHHPGALDPDKFLRYVLYLMEKGRARFGVGTTTQMNLLVDRVGAGMKNQDPSLLSSLLPVFRDAYPDILYRCYVAPSSWIFLIIWAIGKPLVDARQRKRVLLLKRHWQEELLGVFDANLLPSHLGGSGETVRGLFV